MKKKNIFSVIVAVLLSVSILSFNCSAFTFDGENRSLTDIYSDWFLSTRDFVTGNSTFEQWQNDNIRFQTDIIGSNLFPGSDAEFDSYINEIEEKLRTAVEGTDNKVDDTFLDIFGSAVETVGIFDFRDQFEQWYQEKYGKEYYKHDNAFGYNFDTTGKDYYLFYHSGNRDYRAFLSYDGHPLTVYSSDRGSSITGKDIGTVLVNIYVRTHKTSGEITDWSLMGSYSSMSGNIYTLSGSVSNLIVDSTNLPLKYSDDNIVGGDPVTDWDSEFGGELVAPSITLPEIGDLLTDLDNDLKNTDDSDNPNKGVEIKITQLTNKLHNDLSKVIELLKKILEKITDFFDNFFDRLGEFFQSVFVPQDDYFNNAFMDISAEFDDVFSFAGDLRLIVDNCITAYKNGGTRAPEIEISIDGYGSPRSLDFSIFDKSISLVRSVLCAICYASFAFNTYRRIPLYISGGGER